MVVVMQPGATQHQVDAVVAHIEARGGAAFVSRGVRRTIVGVVGDTDICFELDLSRMPGVATVLRVTAPYKLVSAEASGERSVVHVGPPDRRAPIGPGTFTLIAGPPALVSGDQAVEAARLAAAAGASVLRGATYRPRLAPPSPPGMDESDLRTLAEIGRATGLPILVEVVDPADVETVAGYADMLHVGSVNMQNLPLLDQVGRCGRPVLLTRGTHATVEEWLLAAEYIAERGNLDIVLCEAGVRTFDPAVSRALDIGAVPRVQRLSHLPVIVDPSTGAHELVVPLARAAIAAGADGLLVDVHPDPDSVLVDGRCPVAGAVLRELASVLRHLPPLMGRALADARRS
ncbi:3-deoxy-D-arabinoheptulosonate-7-phosphate synthase [Thermasporomyces composti]|uniref:3-deoxy-D-arabinoheptulosonate-7-phosphate synthase n=2 Tax=Thermasporomyces composti TaxID=696763 RepID=A0A3D9V232_THECX|nr:3-deoxy-D-arabinoheptulosonate-7-phosphate synthase [Thermasporomyces composti]